jgi:hypothetical protein
MMWCAWSFSGVGTVCSVVDPEVQLPYQPFASAGALMRMHLW